jgi:flavin reductase (DIM6/NTAB) family NADH-FMN oxidoreductase RutF
MKRLLGKLVSGQSLRHRAVALRAAEQRPVHAHAASAAGEREVTSQLFPASLKPLLLGLARGADEAPAGPFEIRMRDGRTGDLLGALTVAPAGVFEHPDGALDLLRPTSSSVACASAAELAWRYALAWRQARRTARNPHAFQMSFADLKALNVFYMMPRPVYLVSVVHGDAGNLFPMDLVGPLGEQGFLMALRLTSPSVELMRASGRIALSGVPAAWKDAAHRLGDHHRKRSIDWQALPFAVAPSPLFGIPAPATRLGLRELQVRHCEPVGSHMLFAAAVASVSAPDEDEAQLCHVSDMVARWRATRGEPFADA